MAKPSRAAAIEPGPVIRRTIEALAADLAPNVLLALVLVGAPTLLSDSVMAEASAPVIIFVAALAQVLLTTIVLHSTLARLSGKPVPLLRSLVPGLRFWPLAFAVELVTGLAVLAGLVLLVVPGIVLSLRWLVPVPALMSEGLGIGKAMGRSADLTKGHRMKLLGLVLLWVVPFLLAPTMIIHTLQQSDAPEWLVAAIDMAADMAGALTSAAGLAVIYDELRRIKDGATRVAALFD